MSKVEKARQNKTCVGKKVSGGTCSRIADYKQWTTLNAMVFWCWQHKKEVVR